MSFPPIFNRSVTFHLLALFGVCLTLMSACSVWRTDGPIAGENGADQPPKEDGQPYFLPKGLIHLVVTPVTPPAPSTTTTPTTPGTQGAGAPPLNSGLPQLPTGGTATLTYGSAP